MTYADDGDACVEQCRCHCITQAEIVGQVTVEAFWVFQHVPHRRCTDKTVDTYDVSTRSTYMCI